MKRIFFILKESLIRITSDIFNMITIKREKFLVIKMWMKIKEEEEEDFFFWIFWQARCPKKRFCRLWILSSISSLTHQIHVIRKFVSMSKFKFPFEPFRLRLRERKLKIRFFFCLKAKLIQLKFFIALKCEMSSSGWSWSGIDSATCAQSLRIHIHVRLLSRQLFFLFDYQSTSQAKDCGRSESNWLKSSAGYCTISQTLLLAFVA